MLVCPACARLYQQGQSICPIDGMFLVSANDPRTGLQVGNYLIKGPLGEGGMGTVYRGEHVIIGKDVAIKVLHQRMVQHEQVAKRFLMEARAASMIRHPNIVDVTDFGQLPDGCSFFVMEFLEGPNLEQAIAREGYIPLYRAVNILTQVCRALHEVHAKGIVHRDLKPENIVLLERKGHRDLVHLPATPAVDLRVEPEGRWDQVKILDFGVARIQELTAALDQETAERGMVFGSPYYVSPEQATGYPGDFRSDLYALGVIFFEMLTGQVPFDAESSRDILLCHAREPVPSLCATRPDLQLPPEAEQLVQRAMSKQPADRHRSAAHFLEELSNCFGDVIYGRDIDRYLTVKRRRTETIERQSTPANAESGARERPLDSELQELFQGKYEPPEPATKSTMTAIQRLERGRQAPDPDAVKHELAGLFHAEDDE